MTETQKKGVLYRRPVYGLVDLARANAAKTEGELIRPSDLGRKVTFKAPDAAEDLGKKSKPEKKMKKLAKAVGKKQTIMTTNTQTVNMTIAEPFMTVFGVWLEEKGYVDSVEKIESEDWTELQTSVAEAAATLKATRTTKAKRDPAKPKKNKSTYMLWCDEQRAKVQAANPEFGAKEVMAQLGADWKVFKDSKKKADKTLLTKLEKAAEEDKARFEAEMKDYTPSDGYEPETKLKDPDAPKRGRSAYNFFCSTKREEVKAENSEFDSKEVTAELARMWLEIKDTDDATEFTDLAAEDKARYESEMQGYTRPSDAEIEAKLAAKPKRGGKSKKAKADPNKPKRNKSAYLFYCDARRSEIKEEVEGITATEITAQLGAEWNELKEDPEAIAQFVKQAEEDKARYEAEMEAYKAGESGATTSEDEPATKERKLPGFMNKGKPKAKAAATKTKTKPKPKVKKPEPAPVDPEATEDELEEEEEEDVPVKAPVAKKPKAAAPKSDGKKRSAYVVFCQEQRPVIKEDNPSMKQADVTRELSKVWKGMSEEEKAEYAE